MSKLLHLLDQPIQVANYNNDFLLLRSGDGTPVTRIGKAIFNRRFDFVAEVIVTEVEVCLKLNDRFVPDCIRQLDTLEVDSNGEKEAYHLPVYYHEHEDWRQVEAVSGRSRPEVIDELSATEFSILMYGFIPGFIYFDGLDPSLHIPRKKVPAKYVAPNSIALGGQYLGLYSLPSPGGWHVVGQIPIPLLQLPELPPVALQLGDRIHLKGITREEYETIRLENLTIQSYNAQFRDH